MTIYAKDSNVSVINCNFDNNTVYAGNGFGGAIYCPDGYVNAINSNFVNNSASWMSGGAIYSKSISLVNCNLTDNYATWGGAIYSKTYVNVTNSNFKDNFVYANDGGSIYSNGDVKF